MPECFINGTDSAETLTSTSGAEVMYDRGGGDTFEWLNSQSGTDTVKDFSLLQGDKLDISQLLEGYTATDDLSLWVTGYTVINGSDTELTIDLDGSGDGTATQVIVLEGLDLTQTYATLVELATNSVLGV